MQKTWKRVRTLVPIILLAMILARLVWVQLRTFPYEISPRGLYSFNYIEKFVQPECVGTATEGLLPETTAEGQAVRQWLASPLYISLLAGACPRFASPISHIHWNQWLLLGTTIMGALAVRFLTSSWFVSLAVATMLLSRGHIIGDLGVAGPNSLLMFMLMFWMAMLGHFLRTGAAISLAALVGLAMAAALLDWVMFSLLFVFPAVLITGYAFRRRLAGPLLKRLRSLHQKMRYFVQQSGAWPQEQNGGGLGFFIGRLRYTLGLDFQPNEKEEPWRSDYGRGSLLRTIRVPFALWVSHGRRWLKLLVGMSLAGIFSLGVCMTAYQVMASYAGNPSLFGGELNILWQAPSWTWIAEWMRFQGRSLDMHMLLSLCIMVVCAVQSPADGLIGFLEGMWFVLLALVFVLVFAFVADWVDLMMIRAADGEQAAAMSFYQGTFWRPVFDWFEPVILALGAAGIYNLMKVLDTRAGDRA